MSRKGKLFKGIILSKFSGDGRPENGFVDNDFVYFYPKSDVAKCFLGELKNNYKTTKRPVVMIQNNKHKGRKVWRRICCTNCKSNEMYIDYEGKKTLLQGWDDNEDEFELMIKKSVFFPYYWNHSNSAVRCSFRVGIVSIGVSLISLVLSLI